MAKKRGRYHQRPFYRKHYFYIPDIALYIAALITVLFLVFVSPLNKALLSSAVDLTGMSKTFVYVFSGISVANLIWFLLFRSGKKRG